MNGLTARGPTVRDGFVFVRDGQEVWSDFDSMILLTQEQFGSYAEVERMIEAENKAPTEAHGTRGAHTLIDFWFRFSLWFKRMVSRVTKLAGIALVLFLLFAPAWASSGYSAAGERQRYAESLMPESSTMQYFTSGGESQILNIALPEEDTDDVTCDAIVASILADASFTTELKTHGFTHVGCGTAVAPIVVRRTREQQRSPIQDDGMADG